MGLNRVGPLNTPFPKKCIDFHIPVFHVHQCRELVVCIVLSHFIYKGHKDLRVFVSMGVLEPIPYGYQGTVVKALVSQKLCMGFR